MERRIVVRAEMADGVVIEETAASFGAFVDLVIGFRRDRDCLRVEWREAPVARRAA